MRTAIITYRRTEEHQDIVNLEEAPPEQMVQPEDDGYHAHYQANIQDATKTRAACVLRFPEIPSEWSADGCVRVCYCLCADVVDCGCGDESCGNYDLVAEPGGAYGLARYVPGMRHPTLGVHVLRLGAYKLRRNQIF